MSLLQRAQTSFETGGITGLCRSVIHYVTNKTGLKRQYHRFLYWQSNQWLESPVGDTKASFYVGSFEEFIRIKTLMGERTIIEDVLASVGNDDIFFDIGANIGIYSCIVGSHIMNGKVVSFEPVPKNIEHLKRNVEYNGIDAQVCEFALSDRNGETSMSVNKPISGTNAAIVSDLTGNQTEVQVKTGDDVLNQSDMPSPDVIKIDVEGEELAVLRGLRETLSAGDCRLLYCELHRDKLSSDSVEEVKLFLQKRGYTPISIGRRGNHEFIKAEK